jgi:hypothetical protein
MRTFQCLSEEEIKLEEEKRNFIKSLSPEDIIYNFPLFTNRQSLVRFLVRYELFKKILNVKGSIVECGVHKGASLMLFANLSAIYEPYAYNRKIIGFDTFAGFPSVDKKDGAQAIAGDLADANLDIILKSIELYDKNRPVSHISKVKTIKGDAVQTIPKFFAENPSVLVSLLYLDFDLYEPTIVALKTIMPRMPKGAIIAFDELCVPQFPGETTALLETLDINKYELKKLPEEPHISYIRL